MLVDINWKLRFFAREIKSNVFRTKFTGILNCFFLNSKQFLKILVIRVFLAEEVAEEHLWPLESKYRKLINVSYRYFIDICR